MDDYDAIIIGARCAGSPLAMLLARSGARVLLLDRATFPSDTVSTHYIHHAGVARLAAWGLLDELRASGCPPIERVAFHVAGTVLDGLPPEVDGVRTGYAPRRTVLDTILVEAAAHAGAEVRQGASFRAPLYQGDRVAGVTCAAGGREFSARARVVIGADGKHSTLARVVGAETYADEGVQGCMYYAYWSGLPDEGFRVYTGTGCTVIVIPTNDGRTVVAVGWPREAFGRVRADVEGHYTEALREAVPGLYAALAQGERESRIVGDGGLANRYRTSSGPGWALVGDAGHVKDPLCALGITDAFVQAELLGERLIGALGEGPEAVDRATADYAAERDRRTSVSFRTCSGLAKGEMPEGLPEAMKEAAGDPDRVAEFFGLQAGLVSFEEFLAGTARS
ncbi:NAD(P)/FAD-dependent oxidoreductase [Nocardiopsis suaedae]|uniref:NAD(P)/FAD-dependent oxidoreductase n=1 Tax=Nocardiopsis suaedae TaxID=3018444 RepID=A0ABT4TLF9_9ACTN|nr:NAD(P)/FAD-dependent oxidoreductase [Nocardiopsis suaedae]MDA2805540.1 NAD(P)/FAD-dependent oxidoreductase [Nocardiopsis suaedae]